MRVLFGLVALAAAVSAQTVAPTTFVTLGGAANSGTYGQTVSVGQTGLASIAITFPSGGGYASGQPISPALPSGYLTSSNWVVYVSNPTTAITFTIGTNTFAAQLQHRWAPNYSNPATIFPTAGLSIQSYTCDTCAGGTAISCNTSTGPNASPSPAAGYPCALLTRVYTMTGLSVASVNSFSVNVFDTNKNPGPNTSSYSFQIVRNGPAIIGDPQIYGMQGQDFQVHGVPDEIFNMITYPNLQVNARFVYLSAGECLDNYTACFAHPGTYISEEGIRLGSDKIHVRAGAAKKGLTVSVNGKKLASGKQDVKLGSVEIVNHRRVVISTPVMNIAISNSDKFLNQETQLLDRKLLALGAERRVLSDNEKFHAEVPLHGLQGQTWRNVEYPSGLEYEGSISDYQIADGNLFGSSFVFNQFSS